MTKIVIVDDQNSIREFLNINLSTEVGIEVVGMANSAESAIVQVGEHQPDVILMDIEMPGEMDGIDATKIISRRFPNTKILLLTSQDNRHHLNRALEAGARGYILKNTSIKDIGKVIRLSEKGFFQIGPIFGNWDGSGVDHYQSTEDVTEYVSNQVEALVKQESDYSYDDGMISPLEINHAISDLTTNIFELQQTIRSQENTIVNLTNQYSLVKNEIKAKLDKNQEYSNGRNGRKKKIYQNIYTPKSTSKSTDEYKQYLWVIGSFILGVLAVTILMLVVSI